jgi:PhnB protein
MRPQRYRNAVVAHIYIDGAAEGIAFYQRAFGATELFRITDDVGRVVHAELDISGSVVMLGDPDGRLYAEPRALGRTTAELIQPPTEMFYGASSASVRDPFGHVWVLLKWREDLEPVEMERRGQRALQSR